MAGFVIIAELVGIVPDKVDLDEGGGVVQDIHDDKRRLLMFYIPHDPTWPNLTPSDSTWPS